MSKYSIKLLCKLIFKLQQYLQIPSKIMSVYRKCMHLMIKKKCYKTKIIIIMKAFLCDIIGLFKEINSI